MTKLLTDMNRSQRERVVNRLKQEARYRASIADDLAGDDDQLRGVLRTWLFGPAAYAIEDIHRGIMHQESRA